MKTEVAFHPELTASDCVQALKEEGALLIRNFVSEKEQSNITASVLAHNLTPVDRSNHSIPEQFEDIGWEFNRTPDPVHQLGASICKLVRPTLPAWNITDVRAQLYSPGEVGIEWHRDYKRDLRVVAVASFLGSATFDIQLNSAEQTWELEPGDLVLMRGALLNGTIDDRPRHRVAAPLTGRRLSIAYRQVSDTVPDLELNHE